MSTEQDQKRRLKESAKSSPADSFRRFMCFCCCCCIPPASPKSSRGNGSDVKFFTPNASRRETPELSSQESPVRRISELTLMTLASANRLDRTTIDDGIVYGYDGDGNAEVHELIAPPPPPPLINY